MSEYDPFDDLPCCTCVKKSDIISYDTLLYYLNMNDFFIIDKVDTYIYCWELFLQSLIENNELIMYDINTHPDDNDDNMVYLSPTQKTDYSDVGVFILNDIYNIMSEYEIINDDILKNNMDKLIKHLHFLIDNCNFIKEQIDGNLQIPTTGQTSKATQAKQQKILKNWQQAFRWMIEIRDICLKEGPKKRTERDLKRMFNDKKYEITGSQMKYFKTLLPDGYVDREGGAPRQG